MRRLFFTLTTTFLFVTTTFAVGVKPLRTELTIAPGASATATIKVINSEAKEMTVKPNIEVYTKNDAEGFPIPEELSADDPRNIRSWIKFAEEVLTLAPNAEKEVTFTVAVPEGAEPGGRYASLVYEPVTTEETGAVKVATRVASLLLVTVQGEEKRVGNLKNFGFKADRVVSGEPLAFTAEFENTGNVHVKPGGVIKLTDSSGAPLAKIARYTDPKTGQEVVSDTIPVNLDRGNVLPGSSRIFTAAWNENVQPGTYTASLTLYYADGVPPLTKDFNLTTSENLIVQAFQFVPRPQNQGADFSFTLVNSGSVYERLLGSIAVTNEFEQVVKTIELPKDAEFVASGETKTFTIPFLEKAIPAGKYTARLTATHGLTGKSLTAETQFEIASNQMLLLGLGGAVAAVVIVLVTMLVLRRKKRSPEL